VRRAFITSVALAAISTGCQSGPRAVPSYDPASRALVRIDYDYDRDGRVDVRTFMKDGRTERLEGDADGDGQVDRWEYYTADGSLDRIGGSRARDGREDTWAYLKQDEVRVDISSRRDGTVDRREFFRAGVLTRAERDTNRDGAMDTWEEYDQGRLSAWLVDERGSGRPTRRLEYGGNGGVRIEVDPDGDGMFAAVAMPPPVASKDSDRVAP
jgi:hypothetical protein